MRGLTPEDWIYYWQKREVQEKVVDEKFKLMERKSQVDVSSIKSMMNEVQIVAKKL